MIENQNGIEERILNDKYSGQSLYGSLIDTSSFTNNTYISKTVKGTTAITYIRPYYLPGTYDFTDFMECNTMSWTMPFITAVGSVDIFSYHRNRAAGILQNICCTGAPTNDPTSFPTTEPTTDPSNDPTTDPTYDPTTDPTTHPTRDPTRNPTTDPTFDPTTDPSTDPTKDPTTNPTMDPTQDPTTDPTKDPTYDPTINPTKNPTFDPTKDPTQDPTKDPTSYPSLSPSVSPTDNTNAPTSQPTNFYDGWDMNCMESDDIIEGVSLKIHANPVTAMISIVLEASLQSDNNADGFDENYWFAYGFGGNTMDGTYAVIAYPNGNSTKGGEQRLLGSNKNYNSNPSLQNAEEAAGEELVEYIPQDFIDSFAAHNDNITIFVEYIYEESDETRKLTFLRPVFAWDILFRLDPEFGADYSGAIGIYNFMSSFNCNHSEIDVIAARGVVNEGLSQCEGEWCDPDDAYVFPRSHGQYFGSGKIVNKCCVGGPTSEPTQVTSSPSFQPTEDPTIPTIEPTWSPTMEPIVKITNEPSANAQSPGSTVIAEDVCSEESTIRFIEFSASSGSVVMSELDDEEMDEVIDGCKFCLCEAYEDGNVFQNTCEKISDELSETLAAAMLNGCDNLDVELFVFCLYRL